MSKSILTRGREAHLSPIRPQRLNKEPDMATTPLATSWSFSKLQDFTRCKLAFKIKHLDKVPEPERPLPKGRSEHANDRGSRIHDNIETYIRGDHDALCPEGEKYFGPHIDLLRAMHDDGMVEMEQEWAFNDQWDVAPWNGGWVRMKLDFLVHLSPTDAWVGDWKSGRHFGNEVTHANQLNLYALSTFLRHPELEYVTVGDYYVDHGVSTERSFTRDQALRFRRGFDLQGSAITSCSDWPANPNRFSCQWCPWGDTGHCTVSAKK
jgi:hypothetical protein